MAHRYRYVPVRRMRKCNECQHLARNSIVCYRKAGRQVQAEESRPLRRGTSNNYSVISMSGCPDNDERFVLHRMTVRQCVIIRLYARKLDRTPHCSMARHEFDALKADDAPIGELGRIASIKRGDNAWPFTLTIQVRPCLEERAARSLSSSHERVACSSTGMTIAVVRGGATYPGGWRLRLGTPCQRR